MSGLHSTGTALRPGQVDAAVQGLALVNDVLTAMGSHEHLERVNRLILERCVQYFAVEQGVIHLLNPIDASSAIRTAVGLRTEERVVGRDGVLPMRLEIEIVGRMARDRVAIVSNDFASDEQFHGAQKEVPDIRSVLAVPMVSHNRMIGVLTLFNRQSERPFDETDAQLLSMVAAPAAQVIENIRNLMIQEGMRAARSVQEGLLPHGVPLVSGVDLYGFSVPAYEVGGDYYDWIELPDGRIGCVVADVSGKGLPAALLMAELQGAFRALGHAMEHPHEVLNAMVDSIGQSLQSDRFVTIFYAIIDPVSNELTYANAGHNPALVCGESGEVRLLDQGGLIICPVTPKAFESYRVPFGPGDCLVVYTDGVTDAMAASGKQFGEGCLCDAIHQGPLGSAQIVAARIREALTRFSAGRDQFDDITLAVALRTDERP